MNRRTCCPGCQGPLVNYYPKDDRKDWHEQVCENYCATEYRQHFKESFEDTEITYCTLNTKNFHIYIYYSDRFYTNLVHVYSNAQMKRDGICGPILKLTPDKIKMENLTELDEKLSTLALFA